MSWACAFLGGGEPSRLFYYCTATKKALFSEPLWSDRLWLMQTVRILSSPRAHMLHLNSFKNIFELLPRCCALNVLLSKFRWSCYSDSNEVLYSFSLSLHCPPVLNIETLRNRSDNNCSKAVKTGKLSAIIEYRYDSSIPSESEICYNLRKSSSGRNWTQWIMSRDPS